MDWISLKIYTALKITRGKEAGKSVWGLADSSVFENEVQCFRGQVFPIISLFLHP